MIRSRRLHRRRRGILDQAFLPHRLLHLRALGDARAAARVAEGAGYEAPANPALDTNYADVNARERLYGRTALIIAAIEGHLEIVRMLVEAGSDLNIVDAEGSTALSLARSYGNLDVAALLAEAGAL